MGCNAWLQEFGHGGDAVEIARGIIPNQPMLWLQFGHTTHKPRKTRKATKSG
jgi:hypothetical protein